VPVESGNQSGDKKHTVMFYSDVKYKNQVRDKFIKNGLLKGEYCICLVHESLKSVKKQFAVSGIDVDDFLKNNLLHIYQIPDITKDPEDVLTGFIILMKKCLADSKPPYRITGRIIPDIYTRGN